MPSLIFRKTVHLLFPAPRGYLVHGRIDRVEICGKQHEFGFGVHSRASPAGLSQRKRTCDFYVGFVGEDLIEAVLFSGQQGLSRRRRFTAMSSLASARASCASASINAERARERCPAFPQRCADCSIKPASALCRAKSSGWFSAISGNWLLITSAMRRAALGGARAAERHRRRPARERA